MTSLGDLAEYRHGENVCLSLNGWPVQQMSPQITIDHLTQSRAFFAGVTLGGSEQMILEDKGRSHTCMHMDAPNTFVKSMRSMPVWERSVTCL
jgi:hypothetical protein